MVQVRNHWNWSGVIETDCNAMNNPLLCGSDPAGLARCTSASFILAFLSQRLTLRLRSLGVQDRRQCIRAWGVCEHAATNFMLRDNRAGIPMG